MFKITGWKSKALWSKIGVSEDSHTDRLEAAGVANLLRSDHRNTPCDIRGLCLASWVEPEFQTEVAPKAEESAHSAQQLKAEIAAVRRYIADMQGCKMSSESILNHVDGTLRQLSAV